MATEKLQINCKAQK